MGKLTQWSLGASDPRGVSEAGPSARLRTRNSLASRGLSFPRLPRPLPSLLLLGVLLAPFARSETPVDIPPAARNPAPGKSATPSSKESEPASTTPSRFISEENCASYISSLSAVFSMRNRTTDPFGQLQDPEAKRIIKTTVAKTSHRVAPAQATPFADIIRLIKVTTVMPKEQRFLVGTRAIQQGDTIPLNYRGKTLRVEVSAVSSRALEFRNLDTNETASLKLDMLPAGMSHGSHLLAAPGMIPDRPDTPIELESGAFPATEKSPNR